MRVTIGSLQAEVDGLKYKIRMLETQVEEEKKKAASEKSNREFYYKQYNESVAEIRTVTDFLKLIPTGATEKQQDALDSLPLISRIGLWLATSNMGK